ncbi:hypothetical protein Sden_3674 [Shewanella denitrificans OS217]|uniref:Uncharacterized protein n=1 Tax=Shewanella denitrificans (strain OS217 / ATCC BAA-1090 / DSM 15013) TaxID=318161 RepID=Q12HX7_SHEDO|nr:hypothetical protein [Shewanella denitrificans]ABE56949.1 hypothetical protein Sden_3674 [Shewanella denitrificans OS217]
MGYLDGGAVEIEGSLYLESQLGVGVGGSLAFAFNPDGSGGIAKAFDMGYQQFVNQSSFSYELSLATGATMEADDFLNGYLMTYGVEAELPKTKHLLIPDSVNVFQGHTYKKDPNVFGFTDPSNIDKSVEGFQFSKSFDFGSKSNSLINSKVAGFVALQNSTRIPESNFESSTWGQFLYGVQNSIFTQKGWITGD